MIKLLIAGVWICLVTFASAYFVANWQAQAGAPEPKKPEPFFEGIEYHNLAPITVPMINNGVVQGYVVARLTFTSETKVLHQFPGDVQPFLVDETFRALYEDGKIDMRNIQKYDMASLLKTVKKNVNERLGLDLVKDVLVTELNYVEHSATKSSRRD
jgi:hypothetical protein